MLNSMAKMRVGAPVFDTERLYPRTSVVPRCAAGKKELTITRVPIVGENPSDVSGTLFNVLISDIVISPNRYVELVYELLNASSSDKFRIYIKSPGGCVATGFMIIDAIMSTKAHVTTIAVGYVASVAAFMWSFGHDIEISKWSTISYHMSSHSDQGKSMQVAEKAGSIVTFVKMCMEKILKRGLITPEELSKIIDEKSDVNILESTMSVRLKNNNQPTPVIGGTNEIVNV